MFDYVVVGAGLSGSVVSERIANVLGKTVLVIEKRRHPGGNVYDYYDDHGILVHKYGPHIFHTKMKPVWDYLSGFTAWTLYQHRVLGWLDGFLAPIPFNLNSIRQAFPEMAARRLEDKLIRAFGYNAKIPILQLKEHHDEDLNALSNYIYEKVFLHYTAKQWDCPPEQLDPAVFNRVPVYISRDNCYFQDRFQGLPRGGYTRLIENLLASPNIKVLQHTDFKEVAQVDFEKKKITLFGQEYKGTVIYTGMLDELMDYRYGALPYRGLRFEFESFEQPYYQEVGTVNYPNHYDFTRITEFKRLTGQVADRTTIVKEYPKKYDSHDRSDIPYYPIPNEEHSRLYRQYKEAAGQWKQILYTGRLADYSYYDMDMTVCKALELFERICGNQPKPGAS